MGASAIVLVTLNVLELASDTKSLHLDHYVGFMGRLNDGVHAFLHQGSLTRGTIRSKVGDVLILL